MFCALLGQDSGECSKDHWSSGVDCPVKISQITVFSSVFFFFFFLARFIGSLMKNQFS